jgi:myo-inositol-1(or 4)-monophosphatase
MASVTTPSANDLLDLAQLAAEQAAALLIDGQDRTRSLIETKTSGTDMVTDMDKAAERQIVATIRRQRPDDAVVGEEGTAERGSTGVEWIIDPIDGTTNFIHGVPAFAVSIGLASGNELIVGAVHDPCRGETFHARRGGGAFLNGSPIACTTLAHLDGALIATGFPFREMSRLPDYLAAFERFVRSTSGLRRAGSASLDLVYTACGRYDGFFEIGLHAWDLAGSFFVWGMARRPD